MTTANQKPPDGGWGWAIVVSSFFVQFLSYGSPMAMGVLYVEWLEAFDEGKGKTAWIGSLANGVGLLASPLCSASVSAFGVRPVVICSGLLVAGGLILSSFAPSLYFLYFSYGCMVGASIGTFVYASLMKVLISIYGVDGCLIIIGALSLNILPCGVLMRPLPQDSSPTVEKLVLDKPPDTYHEKEGDPEETQGMLGMVSASETDRSCEMSGTQNWFVVSNPKPAANGDEEKNFCKRLVKTNCQRYLTYWLDTADMFRNRVFTALFLAIFLFDIGGFPAALLLEDVAKSANIPDKSMVVPLVSILGISTAAGKLLLGILADCKRVNTMYLYAFTFLATGLTLFAIPYANTYAVLAVLAGIIGFASGNWSIFPYVTTKTVGLDKLTHAYGILMFFAGVGNCLGPPLVGWCFDMTQTYELAFYLSAICVIVGGLLLFIVELPLWDNCTLKSSQSPPKSHIYKPASKA
ncbi:monocarboxylate transporter 9 isoform X2 [Xenopus laevis]|uniref:Monocarboxylate transporter 9 n=1 Tax=Xenopus laevis TaxID=8355 RepID=A0A8J1LCU9_XENLA|nr:monocarboxylate transporter 9 isoform X2 [Xenopus laevis]